MAGFCPYGPSCKLKHLKLVIIDEQSSLKKLANFPDSEDWISHSHTQASGAKMSNSMNIQCHNCGKPGHKSTYCIEDKAESIKIDST